MDGMRGALPARSRSRASPGVALSQIPSRLGGALDQARRAEFPQCRVRPEPNARADAVGFRSRDRLSCRACAGTPMYGRRLSLSRLPRSRLGGVTPVWRRITLRGPGSRQYRFPNLIRPTNYKRNQTLTITRLTRSNEPHLY